MVKKLFKILGITLIALILIGVAALYFASEDKPEGKTGAEADALADKILEAVNQEAWDTTRYVQWTFKGIHSYVWDKANNTVLVEWDNNKVYLNTITVTGKAFVSDKLQNGEKAASMVQKAWGYFCNDSFWLIAFNKLYDDGVSRSIVQLEDGSTGLMLTYNSGGVTPGDSYLWILDENNRPKAWKMWTSIIPVGGLEFSWSNWTQLSTGAWIAQDHYISSMNIDITNLEGGNDISQLSAQEKIMAMKSIKIFP